MRNKIAALAIALFVSPVAWAQVETAVLNERLDALRQRLERVKAFHDRLPENKQRALSSGAQNMVHMAQRWGEVEATLRSAPRDLSALKEAFEPQSGVEAPKTLAASTRRFGAKRVSDPNTDVAFSSVSGFTQSETSTAWCGKNVVVGFNDSGSFWETVFLGSGGLSFNGVATSTNTGGKYTDQLFLNPGTPFDNFLGGDPVVACTDQDTFYYASLFGTDTTSDISVSISTDGGVTWGDPVSAVAKDLDHFLDKEWMAVEPDPTGGAGDPPGDNIYVTYTDFDESLTSGIYGAMSRTAIEFVRSLDGGATWSAPIVIEETCGVITFVQGSQVAVGPNSEVYVAYEFFSDFTDREIDVHTSTDLGASFSTVRLVSRVTPVGDDFALQGGFRAGFDFPSLAVDRSGKATDGNLYIVWHDGRNGIVPDIESPSGTYNYADVLGSRSTDGGACSSSLLIGAETKGSCGPATKKKVRSTRARQCRPSRRVRAR